MQPLARVIGVDGGRLLSPGSTVRSDVACRSLLGGFVIDQAIALHDMQSFAIGASGRIDDGDRPHLDADGIDNQRIALVMADGIPVPNRRHARRVGPV